jgi:AraC-like DNA-binding protein
VGDFDVLEFVAASAPDWRTAIESFLRYTRILNGAFAGRLERSGDDAVILLDSLVPLGRVSRDFQLGVFYLKMSRWLQPMPAPLSVRFGYPQPESMTAYREVFGDAPLRFDAPADAITFDATLLDAPLRAMDPTVHPALRAHAERLFEQHAPPQRATERVRAEITASLSTGDTSAEHVAKRLGMSRRAMSRQLQEHGTTYSDVLAEVRMAAAKEHLEHSTHSIEDIAFALGFSESSAFVRAFRGWTGQTPMAYRRARSGT